MHLRFHGCTVTAQPCLAGSPAASSTARPSAYCSPRLKGSMQFFHDALADFVQSSFMRCQLRPLVLFMPCHVRSVFIVLPGPSQWLVTELAKTVARREVLRIMKGIKPSSSCSSFWFSWRRLGMQYFHLLVCTPRFVFVVCRRHCRAKA